VLRSRLRGKQERWWHKALLQSCVRDVFPAQLRSTALVLFQSAKSRNTSSGFQRLEMILDAEHFILSFAQVQA